MDFDVSNYSQEELIQSLESIDDDVKHPERALLILKQLLSNHELSLIQIKEQFSSGAFFDAIGTFPVLSAVAGDIVNQNADVNEKITFTGPV